MTIERWLSEREDDNFIIEDEYGKTVYDARKTIYEPATYIMNSMIVDIYTWDAVTVLAI